MRFADLVATSDAVAASSARLEKIARLADLLARLAAEEIEIAVAFLSGAARQGRIGIGGATLSSLVSVPPAASSTLDLRAVDEVFARVADATGAGSSAARTETLRGLFARATSAEQGFLARLLVGELRQGALEGILVDAVARAARVAPAIVRRATMFAGALGPVARTALTEGGDALSWYLLRPFQPVQPMLAESADDVASALDDLGEASLEYKLDGARIQAHKAEGDVKVYSRALRDVTPAVPEIVAAVRALPAREVVLDGEAIALRPDRTPHPFQMTMRRFGRRQDVDELRADLPLTPFFFDALLVDGTALVDEPYARRIAVLDDLVPRGARVPRLSTADADEAARFVERALAAGHEGVMAKAAASSYAAGRRGQAWLKVKRAHTLDLVVLAAEWGHGRRRGTLSNLHLGARDPVRGGFVMLGKTFKGLTDALLAWQTRRLLDLEVARDAYTVHVRPELVVEIAFNDIQASPQYPGGLALRFARVKRYRSDKSAADADTIETIRTIYRQTTGIEPPG